MDGRHLTRRDWLRWAGAGSLGLAASWFLQPGAFAEELTRTPRMTEGPFYPDRLPLDKDNDLVVISDSLTPAVGEITHLSGRILDRTGRPLKNALIEIWQVDNNGCYIHSRGRSRGAERDPSFQGYGAFETARDGAYRFRTIKPVVYPGRVPHIHVKVSIAGSEELTTQCFIRGHERNARDGVLRGVRDAAQRDSVQVDFAPIPESETGELAATFDIVLGYTPPDDGEEWF